MQALLGDDAKLERVSDENGDAPAARSASDFSYASEGYAGRGWRVVGDAGGECFFLALGWLLLFFAIVIEKDMSENTC